ncbi:orexin receptor type 2-like isoform X1 [Mytilus californianus]|uniref:orexin receptor type 2-like isoform X1 n=1 Tax=Mytilus californianus TaxID=6549 RepID=UPI00224601EE|nr:orexin receptor type 2-like isoform X1 [Mytilus californianus]
MTDAQEEEKRALNIAIGLMSVCSLVGVIGNALVLYVFSSFKQKLTSTIFILTLATTDFLTCLVTIPFTIAVEALYMKLEYDLVCKMYYFLMTTTVPFSAFVMVAIAVDRYLCICHPFKHVMTIKRAEYIVAFLCVFAVVLGVLCSLNYGMVDPNYLQMNSSSINKTTVIPFDVSTDAMMNTTTKYNATVSTILRPEFVCLPVQNYDDHASFFYIYQKIYSSFFAICCLIVMVLYAMIYRSVLARRRQRLKVVTNQCCGFWNALPNEVEQTEFSTLNTLNNETSFGKSEVEKNNKAVQKNGNDTSISDKDVIIKPGGLSRAKLEKMRMANIKTAFMLSIVTLVFIIAFLPSWLVALRVFDMNVVVFYLFFIYHNANPVIYAFMNNAFKTKLKELFICKRR